MLKEIYVEFWLNPNFITCLNTVLLSDKRNVPTALNASVIEVQQRKTTMTERNFSQFWSFVLHHTVVFTLLSNTSATARSRRTNAICVRGIVKSIFFYNFLSVLFALKKQVEHNWHSFGSVERISNRKTIFFQFLSVIICL